MMLPFAAPINFRQNPTDPVVPLPNAPQAKSALGQVMAGAYNGAVKPAVEFAESPVGFATAGLGALPALAQRGAAALFAPYAFKNAAEATGRAKDAILDPNASLQDKVTPLADALSQGLMAVGASRHAIPAPDLSKLGVIAYHGSPKGGITRFNEDPNGIFFSDKQRVAQGYTYNRGPWYSESPTGTVYQADLAYQNPFEIDAMGARNNNIPYPGQEYKRTVFGNLPKDAVSVEEAARRAFEQGHDALVVRNVMDAAFPDDKTRSTVYAIRHPSQITMLDGNGNPVSVPAPEPVSSLFAPEAPAAGQDARFAELEARAKAGDQAALAEAQTMTDARAQEAGANIGPVYRGGKTPRTIYSTDSGLNLGPASYWSPSEDFAKSFGPVVQKAYLNVQNPIHDLFENSPFQRLTGNSIQEKNQAARDAGYDAILMAGNPNHVVNGYKPGEAPYISEYAVFNPNQIKSADAFTYDDAGKLIPLSQRFNWNNPDIRYMAPAALGLGALMTGALSQGNGQQ